MGNKNYRILSLDGGGIRGVFPATILANFEDRLGKPIGQYFDLIAGTSTGGIIALALGMGVPASRIASLYQSEGWEIFGKDQGFFARGRRALRQSFWGAKHDNKTLRKALEDVFEDQKLGESQSRLVIPSFDPETERVYVYKTQHHMRFQTDHKSPVVDIAMATSAAPTFLQPYRNNAGVELIDGGVWANNPIGPAVVEAIGVLGWPREDIKVLSLGTIAEIATPQHRASAAKMIVSNYIIQLFMAGQSHSSLGTAKLLTGDTHERQAIWRIDQSAPKGKFSLDDPRQIENMKARALTEAREQWPIIQPHFFDEPAEAFVPITGEKV